MKIRRFFRLFPFLSVLCWGLAAGCGSAADRQAPPVPPSDTVAAATRGIPTAESPFPSMFPSFDPSSAPIQETPPPAEWAASHPIGVRVVEGVGEFYDRTTGGLFIPRGFNYVRLAPMPPGSAYLWHATLNPGYYEPDLAATALKEMHTEGYNVVRIFVDCCRKGSNIGDPKGGISEAYLMNVIDFLEKARDNEMYVLLVLDLTPAEGGYDELWQQCCSSFDGENLRYLTNGGHHAESRFNQDFIRALISHHAPLEAVFAYDLTNEVHFSVEKAPFSWSAGRVRTANGQLYDMGIPEDKTRMMDENLVYWIDKQRDAILEVDPGALVTVSFPGINTGETTVHTGPAIRESSADFIDLHMYLGWGLSMEDYIDRFEVDGHSEKPIILGEFGAASRPFPTEESAVRALVELQIASCQYGFDGWLMWTWDTEIQTELWTAAGREGRIAAALSPIVRPDPCSPDGVR